MSTNASAGKFAQTGPSPYLKVESTNPPNGPHLTWMTVLSDLVKGANGSGTMYGVVDSAQHTIGSWKSIGGLVFLGFTLDKSGLWKIDLPGEARYPGPAFFSDAQVVWPASNQLTVTTSTTSVTGWMQYWG